MTAGDHAGKIFIFVEKYEESYLFLSYPDSKNHTVGKDDFDKGLELGIIDYIEKVPKYVRKIVKAQFDKNREEEVAGSPG